MYMYTIHIRFILHHNIQKDVPALLPFILKQLNKLSPSVVIMFSDEIVLYTNGDCDTNFTHFISEVCFSSRLEE